MTYLLPCGILYHCFSLAHTVPKDSLFGMLSNDMLIIICSPSVQGVPCIQTLVTSSLEEQIVGMDIFG